MSSSAHIDKMKRDILALGKGPTQGLDHTLTAGKMYSLNFTATKNKFCWSLHYNGANSYLFVNSQKIMKFKTKDSKVVTSPICLGNISKDWSADNLKKTGLNGYVKSWWNYTNYSWVFQGKIWYSMKCFSLLKNVFLRH